jgi:putative hydrolase of the HAD superfamily
VTRAVFFDAGHTLLYPHPDIGTVYSETTATFGLSISAEAFAAVFVPVFKESTRRHASTLTASDEQDLAMWREITRTIYDRMPALHVAGFEPWFEALYGRFGDSGLWRFYDDVEPVLRELKSRGLRIGIISNWDTRLKRISDDLGLTALVDFLVISAEAGMRKPDPRIFHLALEKAGVRPEDAMHVGDLPEEDAEGARRAGVRPILIDRRKRVTPNSFPADVRVVGSLPELLTLL